MKLRDLFSDDAMIDPQAEAVAVSGLAVDSRAVKPGDLFFALTGHKTDGARFIDSAVSYGAVAVAADRPPQAGIRVPFVVTPNPRRALALAAAKFYPRQPETIAAVTGTSGKTSVAAFTRQIWQRLGHASASIGTIGLVSPKRTLYGSLTTPDPIALHRQLDEIARDGVTHLAFEASSHGLDQLRLDGAGEGIRLVEAGIGGFAQNLGLEHRGRQHPVRLPLVGEFQIENALVSAGLAIGTGSDPDQVLEALEHLEGAKGRLERVGERNGAPIFVDYAHKPDALAKALQALRPYARRKLVVVFGAGGDRDAGKRPIMGSIAHLNADRVIVTDDNPRSENPDAIRAAILAEA